MIKHLVQYFAMLVAGMIIRPSVEKFIERFRK